MGHLFFWTTAKKMGFWKERDLCKQVTRPGKHTKAYWTWPSRNSGFINNGWIFYSYVSLPEGTFNVSGSHSKVPMVFKWECSILSKLIKRWKTWDTLWNPEMPETNGISWINHGSSPIFAMTSKKKGHLFPRGGLWGLTSTCQRNPKGNPTVTGVRDTSIVSG